MLYMCLQIYLISTVCVFVGGSKYVIDAYLETCREFNRSTFQLIVLGIAVTLYYIAVCLLWPIILFVLYDNIRIRKRKNP